MKNKKIWDYTVLIQGLKKISGWFVILTGQTIFFCIYKMCLISVEGYENARVYQRFDWYNSHCQGLDVEWKVYILFQSYCSLDSLKEHLLFCNHTLAFEDFLILATNNDFKVTLIESLLINTDHPPLNKNKQSLPLELFDS